jgi:transcriptional regulator with XRE-family HTH domain
MPDRSELGKRIKKVRESRRLTLKNIEARAGISATHISEIERGKTSPTLGALIKIAEALGKEPAYFVEERDLGDASIVTKENRIREPLGNGAGTFERLTASIPGGQLQGSIIELEPGGPLRAEHEHSGHEAALVLAGRVDFTIGGTLHSLVDGDAIVYDAAEPHSYRNPGATSARILWVCSERDAT